MPLISIAWMKTATVVLSKARWDSRHRKTDSDRNGPWDNNYFVRSWAACMDIYHILVDVEPTSPHPLFNKSKYPPFRCWITIRGGSVNHSSLRQLEASYTRDLIRLLAVVMMAQGIAGSSHLVYSLSWHGRAVLSGVLLSNTQSQWSGEL